MSDLARATDFKVSSIKVDGHEIRSIFFAFDIYENLFSAAITGSVLCVETESNQFLSENKIEGNEEMEVDIECAGGERLEFKGYLNKISNRVMAGNGQSTYNLEFVSEFIRQNEQTFVTKRYKNTEPNVIVKSALEILNKEAGNEIPTEIMEGNGMPMNFVASNWSPKRLIQYIQKHGVPKSRPGNTSYAGGAKNAKTSNTGRGTGGFFFYETLTGCRFGSVIDLLSGKLGKEIEKPLEYKLANRMESMEATRSHILSYNNVQNNDTQSQQISGSFRSKFVGLDMDTGQYIEQEWESELATEKQKKTSRTPTRVFSSVISNEKFSSLCERTAANTDDQKLRYMQQAEGTFNNFYDGICQVTIPARPDIHPGDSVKLNIFETSIQSAQQRDTKYSGRWIVSGVAHHALLETAGAYSKLTLVRPTNQTDEMNAKEESIVPPSSQ